MGDVYQLYPKMPKNIRQIGERDPSLKLYVEDYVNTYLKRLHPSGGRSLRAGLLLGEMRAEDGVPLVFADGALEFEGIETEGGQVTLTDEAWKQAYRAMEQSFPRRSVVGWFVCGAPESALSPVGFWKQHAQHFPGKHQVMYLNSSPDGGEAVYMASEEGFYRLRGYSIYYERNQMMQDYMVSRRDAHRVESGAGDDVTRDFRQKMENRQLFAKRQTALSGMLATACGVLSVAVLAGGFVLFGNYRKMKEMESVIASVLPDGNAASGAAGLLELAGLADGTSAEDGLEVEEVSGNVYPVPEIRIESGESSGLLTDGGAEGGGTVSGADASGQAVPGAQDGGSASSAGTAAAAGETAAEEASAAPDAAEAASVRIPENAVSYVVQEGETLYGICLERYHSISRLDEICRWNGLDDRNHIRAGQELYLPAE